MSDNVIPRQRADTNSTASVLPTFSSTRRHSSLSYHLQSRTSTLISETEEKQDTQDVEAQIPDKWTGRKHRKLSEEGYRSLAILATFLAAVQAQILSSTLGKQGAAYDVVNACFIGGLLADIFASMISYGSARWFEMLTREEESHFHDCWVAAESENPNPDNIKWKLVDRWISFSIATGPYAVLLGLVFLIVGLMTFVWAYQPLVVIIISTFVCVVLAIFIPPFALKHDRKTVLSLLRLKRRSG